MILKLILLFTFIFTVLLYGQYRTCLNEVVDLSAKSADLVYNISDSLTKERDDGTLKNRPLMDNYVKLQDYVSKHVDTSNR